MSFWKVPFFAAVFLSLKIVLFADPFPPSTAVERSQVEETNLFGLRQGKITSPTKEGWGFFLEASFLYWLPDQGGLEYAFQMDSATTSQQRNPNNLLAMANGRYKRAEFQWGPGVELEAGCHLFFDSWDLLSRWTRFVESTQSSTSIPSLTTHTLSPLWLGADFTDGYPLPLAASSRWNLHYNVVDLALKRAYFSSSSLVLAPQAGLRGSWINQHFVVGYSGGEINLQTTFKGKNDFNACGIFSRIDMEWRFVNSWRLLGQLLGALNFGRYHLSQQTTAFIPGAQDVYLTYDNPKQFFHRTRFCYEAAIGLEWEYAFPKGHKLSFSALYNLNQWLHMNQLRMFSFSDATYTQYFVPRNDSLSFQGISIAGRCDF